jgi:hypothetical protein
MSKRHKEAKEENKVTKITPTLYLAPHIHAELMYIANNVDAEVGGLGVLSINDENGDIFVDELFLLDQEVSGGECTLQAKSITTLLALLIQNGEKELIPQLNFWWHSHHTMGAFFSGTDDATMKDWDGKYMVALVINKKGELKARLVQRIQMGPPFEGTDMLFKDLPVCIDWSDNEYSEDLDEQIANNVHKKVYVAPTPNTSQWQQKRFWYGGAWHDTPEHQQAQLPASKDEEKGTPRSNVHTQWGYEWEDWDESAVPPQKRSGFHELTEEEWKKIQDENAVEDELRAKEINEGLETWIEAAEMDEEEAAEVRRMFTIQ